jgi:integrase
VSTGSVYQRRDGRWCAALQVAGRRKVIYGRSKAEARQRLAHLQRQCAVTGRLPDPGRRTVANLLDEWVKVATLRPRTKTEYAALLDRYVRPIIGHVRLARLEPVHLQRLYASLQARGLARAPSQVHRLLHRAFRIAVLWGWLSVNPADRVLPPTYTSPRRPVWTTEELRLFLNATGNHRLQPMWVVLATTGIRIGEALALTWDNVNLISGMVTITRTLHRLRGRWVTTEPKTRAGQRPIALPYDAVIALRHQRRQQDEWRLVAGPVWHDGDLVFTTSTGRPLDGATIGRALRSACSRSGVPPMTHHGFRHCHASMLLSEGVPLPTVSARLGHGSPAVTTRVYAHAMQGDDKRAAQAIEGVLAGGR